MYRRPGAAATALLLAALTLGSTPPASADLRPSPIPIESAIGAPAFSPPPSVDVATRQLQARQQALATETAKLTRASSAATAALQAYQVAKRDAADAKAAAGTAAIRARDAQLATETARRQLQSYAGSLYKFGVVDPRVIILSASLTSDEPQQFVAGINLARQVGQHQGRVVNSLGAAELEQAAAAVDARDTATQAVLTTARAASTNAAAAKAVASYRREVARKRADLAKSSSVLARAKLRERNLERARDIARQQGWTSTPSCVGGDVNGYDNGRLPVDALCPLLFTTSMRLRADAAYAFNRVATEYAATFGTPLCITDSYRSYDAQVAVAAEKPDLAADPGHSNHGWGIAVDLCGGIESFDTPVHLWMLDNAVIFGWFHPGWAEPEGSKPEPWHWEFAG